MLDDMGISYEEINIDKEAISRDDLMKITKGYSVPQIVINGTSIGGFDSLLQLNQSGKLEKLLAT
tara:strand:+ start:122 stop:316 length:195 start_codon:yes stop_codon:yes gene_type:complete